MTARNTVLDSSQSSQPELARRPDPPRIAVYDEPGSPPLVISLDEELLTPEHWPQLIEAMTSRAFELARERGGRLPAQVFRELIENLVHASFQGAVVTILDQGNTLRVTDSGPGIPDKQAALQPGFTSAEANAKRFIRGVGSGLSLVQDIVSRLGGTLLVEDNLGHGTVVTVSLPPENKIPLATSVAPSYNLPQRQLKVLLLVVELAPAGPTRIAQELGVSASTAYRDLAALEEAGLISSDEVGRRSVTEAGMAYLSALL